MRRPVAWSLAALALALAALVGAALAGAALPLPGFALARIEARLAAALPGQARVEIGRIGIRLGEGFAPVLRLQRLALVDAAGAPVIALPAAELELARRPLLDGVLAPRALRLEGGEAVLRRDAQGRVGLALGAGAPGAAAKDAPPADPLGMLAAVRAALASGPLASLRAIEAEGLSLRLEDARAGRTWRAGEGAVRIAREADAVALTLDAALAREEAAGEGDGAPPPARLRVTLRAGGGAGADFAVSVTGVPSEDLAAQSPALAYLRLLDAPISGSLRGALAPDGRPRRIAGALEIGPGAVRPAPAAAPLPFGGGKAYFAYDPAAGAITFDEVALRGAGAELALAGTAFLRGADGALPDALEGQFRIARLRIGGPQTPPLAIDGGATLRLRLAPFRLDIAEAHLGGAGATLRAAGTIGAEAGWTVALDASSPGLSAATALAAWPPTLAAGPRRWLAENLTAGRLTDVAAALRLRPGAPRAIGVTASFEGAGLRFLREMPPLEAAAGWLAFDGRGLTVTLSEGQVAAPGHGAVDAAGTIVRLPDFGARPVPLEVSVAAEGRIPDAVALLEGAPVRFAERTGRGPDIADGSARVSGLVALPLARPMPPGALRYAFEAALTGVSSETLVPGRRVEADRLSLEVLPAGVTVRGPVRLDGVPADIVWRRAFGPGESGSALEGRARVTPDGLAALGIGLGGISVSGAAEATFEVALPAGAPPRLTLGSDLAGLGLGLPALGWSKPAAATGRLDVEAVLGAPPVVERLALAAAGLQAEGSIALAPGGGLAEARFDRVRLGSWLDAPVRLEGRGAGRSPAVALTGGTVDLSRRTGSPAGGGSGGGPLRVALDRLVVGGGIALAPFRAELGTAGGLSGSFTGRLGEVPVEGRVDPAPGGTAVRARTADAGAALAAAGIFRSARGGSLDLALTPIPGAPGTYSGQASIASTRVRDAPVMAALLNAISIVGLLDELGGAGIVFDRVDAGFRLAPGRVALDQLSATGASLGLTLDGVYDTEAKRLDMRGVLSPVYLLNGIGEVLARPGEGVFGIAFGLTGPASAPRVEVNPISLFTPGALRDLFRRPPPAATQ